ncbi:MAG: Nif3-like dinuclear metal center hexameric protein [bacterium]|jgi:dinuclear metal center YbgI/SA1388 family protein
MANNGRSLSEVVDALGALAPLSLAGSWDKVGLLVAGDGRPVTRALLAIDVVPEVLAEAKALGAELIVGYHPLIFTPLERLDGATWQGRVAIDAVRAGIAVYSPHTALDAVEGGINDWLIELIAQAAGAGVEDCRALQPATAHAGNTHKLVTFVPEADAGRVRDALSAAGAGQVGLYSHCSFAAPGEGTFLGGAGANPAVGKAGRLERVPELRLEMPFHKRRLAAVLEALRASHPYEEPAFDIVALEALPIGPRVGAGRIARLSKPCFSAELAESLQRMLGCSRIDRTGTRLAGRSYPNAHTVIAVCAGSGASLLDAAAAQGATCFLTGELSHHDVLRAHALGLEVLLAGHTNTERGYLPRLAGDLAGRLPGLECVVSTADRDPLAMA